MTSYNCPECGKGEVQSRVFRDFSVRVRGYPFIVPEANVGVCDSCGKHFLSPAEIQRWATLYDNGEQGNLLTAGEISGIRNSLNLSIGDFALLLGCTRQTIYNWEREDRKAPQLRMADLLLRLLELSIRVGSVDVVSFLRQQAQDAGVHIETRLGPRATTCGAVEETWLRSSADYDRLFGVSGAATEIPPMVM